MNKIVRGSLAAAGLVALTLWDQRARRSIAGRAEMLRVGDAILEYESTGSGPAVLVLHGSAGGFDQGTWLGHVLGLRDHRVIAVSRPGYLGTTDRRTTDEAVALVAAGLDQLGLGRVVVIGVSGGGMAACRFAMLHPDRVRALVMLSAVSGPVFTGSAVADISHVARGSLDVNQAASGALVSRSRRKLLAEFVTTFSAPERRIRGVIRDVENSRTFAPPVGVTPPTLIVHGTADGIVPFAHAERTLSGCINGELVPIKGGGHLACLTHDELGTRVREFLARHDA